MKDKIFQNLLLALVAVIGLLFGGSMLSETLLTKVQTMFFGGMLALAVIVFIIWMALKINRDGTD